MKGIQEDQEKFPFRHYSDLSLLRGRVNEILAEIRDPVQPLSFIHEEDEQSVISMLEALDRLVGSLLRGYENEDGEIPDLPA